MKLSVSIFSIHVGEKLKFGNFFKIRLKLKENHYSYLTFYQRLKNCLRSMVLAMERHHQTIYHQYFGHYFREWGGVRWAKIV